MTNDHYVIATGRKGRDRLRLLTRVFAETTIRLLDRVDIGEGMSCLDVGCGGGDISTEFGRRVGPAGRVLGIDLDAVALDIARREAAEQNLGNVTYEVLDVIDLTESGKFDVVYARFLLSHLPEPQAALASMAGVLQPGGILIVEDVEFSAHFCFPECPAFGRYVSLYMQAARARGDDPDIGPRLPSLLRKDGLSNIDLNVVQPAAISGETKLISPLTMENIGDAVIASGLASASEVERIVDELYAEARNEETLLSTPRIVQAWGRKR